METSAREMVNIEETFARTSSVDPLVGPRLTCCSSGPPSRRIAPTA
jgi:hypothetical protein